MAGWDSSDSESVDESDRQSLPESDDESQEIEVSEEEEESDGTFCNTTLPQLYPGDYLEQQYHRNNTSNGESEDEDDFWYRTRATGDTDSVLLLGTAPVFNNVIDSASPDGSVFNFSSIIRRTKTERGSRTTLFFDRQHPVPKISGKSSNVQFSNMAKPRN